MTTRRVLDADLGEVARWIQQGWTWWIGELSDMAPVGWRRSLHGRIRWSVRMGRDGVPALWRDGLPVAGTARVPTGARAELVLPPDALLVRELEMPRLSKADLTRMLVANMDRFTPFPADRVYADAQFVGSAGEGGRGRLRLAVITRDRAWAMLELAQGAGVEIARMGPEGDGGAPPIDFMPAILADKGGVGLHRRAVWWTICAGLVVLNLLTAVVMDMRDIGRLRERLEAEQPRVEATNRIRQAVLTERDQRLRLLRRRSQNEPLRIIAAVTQALSAEQWVQRFEWNGRTVRLAGSKAVDFDISGALGATPALTRPRSLLSDMSAKPPGGKERFDVIADSRTRAAP